MTMSKVHTIDHVWVLALLPIPRPGPENTRWAPITVLPRPSLPGQHALGLEHQAGVQHDTLTDGTTADRARTANTAAMNMLLISRQIPGP
ncbi:hypothetical protein [Nocardia fusca]|uniref:hypothetical protein n=1 Tax=Nocardia fusca TaxID=941183 RepID=UPI001E3158D8|nr:hypothetical protein [Nocardia fusca]